MQLSCLVLRLTTPVAALLLSSIAAAAPFEDGLRAFEQRDYAAALRAFSSAAAAGDADAQYMLGRLYADGSGVLQNFIDAHVWYSLAAAQGQRFAAVNRELLAARMTPEQVAEAQRRAAAGIAAPTDPPPSAAQPLGETEIAQIQLSLKRLGYPIDTINGQLDERTRRTIAQYQRDQRLQITGSADRALLERLNSDDSAQPRIRRGVPPPPAPSADEVEWKKLL